MRGRIVGAALLVALVGRAPLAAQDQALRVATRMEIVEVKDDTPNGAVSLFSAIGPMMKQMLAPDGPIEQVMYVKGDAVRTEVGARMAMLPKGSVILKPVGQTTMFVVNPAEKTYSKLPTGRTPGLPGLPAGMTPDVKLTPTGETETISGANAEKHAFVLKFPMPTGGREALPGMPTELVMQGDLWFAADLLKPDEVALFERMQKAMPMASAMGVDKLSKPGAIGVRSRMRMSILPGYEMRSEVTSISRVALADDLFALPEGFKEVPLPTPMMPGPPR